MAWALLQCDARWGAAELISRRGEFDAATLKLLAF
jgi:hypothetical protein